jgi:hypothetical protein
MDFTVNVRFPGVMPEGLSAFCAIVAECRKKEIPKVTKNLLNVGSIMS